MLWLTLKKRQGEKREKREKRKKGKEEKKKIVTGIKMIHSVETQWRYFLEQKIDKLGRSQ